MSQLVRAQSAPQLLVDSPQPRHLNVAILARAGGGGGRWWVRGVPHDVRQRGLQLRERHEDVIDGAVQACGRDGAARGGGDRKSVV